MASPVAEQVDVVVVGAGPTGLAAAAQALHSGARSVAVVDRNGARVLQSKGAAVMPRTLEMLARFCGVVERMRARAVVARFGSVATEHGRIALMRYSGRAYASAFDGIFMVEQWFTESVLEDFVAAHGGAVCRGVEVVGIACTATTPINTPSHTNCYSDSDDSHVVLTLRTSGNSTKTIHAKYVIACDGARSTIRKSLNIPFTGHAFPYSFVVLHYSLAQDIPDFAKGLSVYMYRDSSAFAMELPENTFISGIDLSPEQDKPFQVPGEFDSRGRPLQRLLTKDECEALLQRALHPGIRIKETFWAAHLRVNALLADSYAYAGRVFLAGDAAHTHTPVGAQGLNYGIQDAVNLGWKLALVVNGKARRALLQTYEAERKPMGVSLLAMTGRLQYVTSTRSWWLQKIRNFLMSCASHVPMIVNAQARMISGTSLHYQTSSISAEHWGTLSAIPHFWRRMHQMMLRNRVFVNRVCAGDRWPTQPTLCNVVEQTQVTGGFMLVVFQGLAGHLQTLSSIQACTSFTETAIRVSNNVITEVRVVPTSDVQSHASIGAYGQCAMLVRPDGHVAFRCEPPNIDMLASYMHDRLHINIDAKAVPSDCVSAFKPVTSDWTFTALCAGFVAGVCAAVYVRYA